MITFCVLMILSRILYNTKAGGLVYFNLYSGKIIEENTGNKRRKIDQDRRYMKYKKGSGLICSNLYSGKRTGGGPASSSCTLPSSCANCKHKNPDGENNNCVENFTLWVKQYFRVQVGKLDTLLKKITQ